MARLTWDSVRGPDFSGISDSYRTMSSLLGNAVQSGLGMIDTVRDTNTGAADRAIMQRLSGVQDLSQLNPADIIGADGSNASLGVLEGVANRRGTLLDWATKRDSLDQSQYDFGRAKAANEILDNPANRDAIAQARILAATDLPGAQRILSGLGLRADQFASVLGDLEQSATSALNREVTGQNLTESRYGFSRTQRTDTLNDQLQKAEAYLTQNSVSPEHRERLLYQQGYAPEVVNSLIGRAAGTGGASGGGVPSLGSGGISAALGGTVSTSPIGNSGATFAEPQRAVANVLHGAGISAPVIAGIMGNLHVEGGYGGGQGDKGSNPGRGDGGSASGIAQWREGRRDVFRQRYGVDPHQATHQQQAEYMLWELTTPEGRSSAGVSKDRADQILNARTPQEAAELFDQYYERSNGAHRSKRVDAANDFAQMFGRAEENFGPVQNANTQADIMRAGGMANSGSLNQRLFSMEGQDIDMTTLTRSLVGEDGPLKGYTEGEIADEIRALAGKAKISNAQAAEILKENVTSRSGGMGALAGLQRFGNGLPIVNWLVPDAGVAENTFDRDMNLETARQYKEGGLKTFDQNNRRTVASGTIAQVQSQIESLDQQIQQAGQRFSQTGSQEALNEQQRLIMERALLLPQMEALRQGQQNTPELTTRDFAEELKRRNELVRRGVSEGVNRAFPNQPRREFRGDRNMR